jgi:DNA polymerase kappa
MLLSTSSFKEFVRNLPVRKAFGIGKVTEQHLAALGIVSCQDLFDQRALLSLLFTETSAMSFLRISMGLGSTSLGSDEPAKSVSNEETFRDNGDPEFLRTKCKRLCEELSLDLKKKNLVAETVTLKLKTDKFDVKTRAKRMTDYTDDGDVFWRFVRPLLEAEMNNGSVSFRLMGVRASTLRDNDDVQSTTQTQLTLDKMLTAAAKSAEAEKTCPVCSVSLKGKTQREINSHVDVCLSQGSESVENPMPTADREKSVELVDCPVCSAKFSEAEIQRHVEQCLDACSGPSSSSSSRLPLVKCDPPTKRKKTAFTDRKSAKKSRTVVGTLDAYFKKCS